MILIKAESKLYGFLEEATHYEIIVLGLFFNFLIFRNK